MQNSLFGGVTLYGQGTGNIVGQNHLQGKGAYALALLFFYLPEDRETSNTFTGNNISGFESSIADVFFDVTSADNTLAGHSGSVVDLGTGNRISGHTKNFNGLDLGRFKDARAAKLALIRSLRALEKNAGPF